MSTTEIYARSVRDMIGESEGITFEEPSMTQQQFKDDCNINVIIERFNTSGVLPTSQETGVYGDFSAPELRDYSEALNVVTKAQADFEALPADVRDRFNHDPANLLNFMADEANYDEAVSLGLVKPPEIEINANSDGVDVPPSGVTNANSES